MHKTSYDYMSTVVTERFDSQQPLTILDIGSYNVNGSYKSIFNSPQWKYTGLDVRSGPNVDIVAEPYCWPIESNTYDIVISGQCLEHVEMPWLWIKEVERVCKPKGFVVIIVPYCWPEHKEPLDCWRILPDGLRVLLTKCADFKIEYCKIINKTDTVALAIKN